MKKIKVQNSNGIAICDSIVMSVKKKRPNMRVPEAILIAVIGFVSVIMSFLGMFEFNYNVQAVAVSAVALSVFYIIFISVRKGALWILTASLVAFLAAAFKMRDKIADGFKFVYNIIYKTSFHSEINYYKHLDPADEVAATTTLFFFALWLIAFVLYFFTIYRPNMIMTLIVTFPVIEIGLYNGIEIPVFWGMLTVAYWFAMFCMSITDFGEYSGGTGGFVRKENVFFPKRHMKLKVTEKSSILVIVTVLIISCAAVSVIKLSGYKRSAAINKKRVELSEAFSQFTINDLTDSLSRITNVFGVDLKKNNDKLGSKDKITFKNKTDLVVTFDKGYDGAIYIKGNTSSIYGDNEWKALDDDAYNADVFNDFSKYKIFPQDFPIAVSRSILANKYLINMDILSKLSGELNVCPYVVNNNAGMSYDHDISVLPLDAEKKELSYSFMPFDAEAADLFIDDIILHFFNFPDDPDSELDEYIYEFCSNNNIDMFEPSVNIAYSFESSEVGDDEKLLLTQLIENKYREFVYDNYLQLPDNENMDEIRAEFEPYINAANDTDSFSEKLRLLTEMREKIASGTEYTLAPGKTPSNRDFANYFLLENKKGYCVHYATSGVLLARMAGIPARFATGYIVIPEDFNVNNQNEDKSFTINVEDNRSHAWVELYIDGYGWMPYEFTAGYIRNGNNFGGGDAPTDPASTQPTQSVTSTGSNGNSAYRTTTSTTTAAPTTSNQPSSSSKKSESHYGVGFGSGGGDKVPASYTLSVLLIPISIAALIYLRRVFIIKRRRRRFENGKCIDRMGYMFDYSNKLLGLRELKKVSGGYKDFAKEVEQHIGGKLFPVGDYDRFTDIALSCSFSGRAVDADDMRFCNDFIEKLASEMYKNSGFFRKIWMKLGSVVI